MRLLFNTENQKIIEIQLRKNKQVVDETHLTVGQGFDIVLIRVLDKILRKHKIDRLSLKSVEIRGKMDPNRVSSMVLDTVARALNLYK